MFESHLNCELLIWIYGYEQFNWRIIFPSAIFCFIWKILSGLKVKFQYFRKKKIREMSENKHNFVWQDLFPTSVINPFSVPWCPVVNYWSKSCLFVFMMQTLPQHEHRAKDTSCLHPGKPEHSGTRCLPLSTLLPFPRGFQDSIPHSQQFLGRKFTLHVAKWDF